MVALKSRPGFSIGVHSTRDSPAFGGGHFAGVPVNFASRAGVRIKRRGTLHHGDDAFQLSRRICWSG
jgi:hypothetical protein